VLNSGVTLDGAVF